MKYKVSLLPEINKKRLNSKKKIEKIKIYALIILLVLLIFLGLVLGTKFFAESRLEKIKALNNESAQKVAELEQYRQINENLQNKLNLIQSIQVEEPQLYNFIATLSNLQHPGVSIDGIECTNWKTSRNCVLTGTASTRQEYQAFEESLRGIKGVSSVTCTSYVATVSDDGNSTTNTYTITITCTGGAAVITTTEAATEATTAADEMPVE